MAIQRRCSDRWRRRRHRPPLIGLAPFVAAGLPRHFRGGITPPHGEVNSPLRFGVIWPRVRSGFPMAIKRGCADRGRRFRNAGARSRFLQPVTRHRCEGTPRRVAASCRLLFENAKRVAQR